MKMYVGNLSYDLTEDELKQKFMEYGEVGSVSILTDRETGRPKGFGFVEMASKTEAEAAIAGLNGKMIKDRTIVVNEARPRADNRSGGGSSGGNRYGGGGYGGGGGARGGENRRRY
jgi:cold-inducible RNA-binding protein